MFGTHFYHATLRKSVAVFGTLFNNLQVIRRTSGGDIVSSARVPLAYGPKQKFLARIDSEVGQDASISIKLPRMAFEMTSLTLDPVQKLQKRNVVTEVHASDVTKRKTIKHYTSYDIGMSLYIMAKNQDDGLQIMEQILPYFQPDYTVTIRPIDGWTTYKQDVPVILQGVSIDDQYEGDFTERRVLIYQLDFIMKMKFYGPAGDQGIIREINIDFNNDAGGSQILENMDITINPTTAAENGTYNVVTTISNTQSGTAATSGDSGSEVSGITNYTITVGAKSGYVESGESNNAYYYAGAQAPTFTLVKGRTYRFLQGDTSNSGHPFGFSTNDNNVPSAPYTTGVTTSGTPGDGSAYTQIVVANDAPNTLYYYCSNHLGMGGQINIIS